MEQGKTRRPVPSTPRTVRLDGTSEQDTRAPHQRVWSAVRAWFITNTFAPEKLPERWRHPAMGYLLAVVAQVVATLITLVLLALFPTYSFAGVLEFLVVALMALRWGGGPSLVATVAGVFLLELVLAPEGITEPGIVVEVGLFLLVGTIISVMASSAEQARRKAVLAQTEAQAREMVLREVNERTDEFIGVVSHELRSPLTSIKAALQLTERRLKRLLAEEGAAAADAAERLDPVLAPLHLAQQQVDRQNRLVGDLLDVSRIRAGKLEMRFARANLATIVEDVVVEQRLVWPTRVILLHILEDPLSVRVDADRIGQVITNYLTNALKYSTDDQPVDVTLRRDGSRALVSVRDRGPGLSPAQQAQIWERFHRVPGIAQQASTETGLGLGLYISRTLIERHDGQVGLESTPGKGSTFWFALPLAAESVSA